MPFRFGCVMCVLALFACNAKAAETIVLTPYEHGILWTPGTSLTGDVVTEGGSGTHMIFESGSVYTNKDADDDALNLISISSTLEVPDTALTLEIGTEANPFQLILEHSSDGVVGGENDPKIVGIDAESFYGDNTSLTIVLSDVLNIDVKRTNTGDNTGAQGHVYGISSGSTRLTVSGSVKITTDFNLENSGRSHVNGQTMGVWGAGDVFAGDVTISDNRTATIDVGESTTGTHAGYDVHGVVGGYGSAGGATGGTITISGQHTIVAEGSVTGVFPSVYSSGDAIGILAHGGAAVATGNVSISVERKASAGSNDYTANADGNVYGVREWTGAGSALAKGTVTLTQNKHSADSNGGYVSAAGDTLGVTGSNTATAEKAVEITGNSRSATSSASSATVWGDTIGLWANDTAAAYGGVTISGNSRTASVTGNALAYSAEATGAIYGLLGHYVSADGGIKITGNVHEAAGRKNEWDDYGAKAVGDTIGAVANVDTTVTGGITLTGNKRTATAVTGGAHAEGRTAGATAGYDIGITGDIDVSDNERTAETQSAGSNALVGGDTYGAVSWVGGTFETGDISVTGNTRKATAVNGTANAAGVIVAARAVGASTSMTTGALTVTGNEVTVKSAGGHATAGASAAPSLIMGAWASAPITVTGGISVSDNTVTVGAGSGNGIRADAVYHLYGLWADGGNQALVTGNVAVSNNNITATGRVIDASGILAGVSGGETEVGGTVSLIGNSRSGATANGSVDIYLNTIGVSGATSAEVGGLVTISGGNYSATATGAGTANVFSLHRGVYSANGDAEAKNGVTISGNIVSAETKGAVLSSRNANATLDIVGVLSEAGTATATGDVNITNNMVTATTNYGNAVASGNIAAVHGYAGAESHGDILISGNAYSASSTNGSSSGADATGGGHVHGLRAITGDAVAHGAVTIEDDTRTADASRTSAGPAEASGSVYGISAEGGNATAKSDVVISGVSRTIGGRALNYQGGAFGVSAIGGDAVAQGAVSITDVKHDATIHRVPITGLYGLSSAMSAGVLAQSGNATANGEVTVESVSTVKSSGNNLAAVIALDVAAGVMAGADLQTPGSDTGVAIVHNNVTASSTLTNTAASTLTYEIGAALGVSGLDITIDAANAAGSTVISTTSDMFSYGVTALGFDLFSLDLTATELPTPEETITRLNGNVSVSATTRNDDDNDFFISTVALSGLLNAFNIGIPAVTAALPIKDVEYLGLGSNDTLEITPGSGNTFNNGGNSFRALGAEEVVFGAGTADLAFGEDDSWFINQRDFSLALATLGAVDAASGIRTTTITVDGGDDVALFKARGDLTPTIGADQGFHKPADAANQRYSEDGSLIADRDYYFVMNVADGGLQITEDSGGDFTLTAAGNINIGTDGYILVEEITDTSHLTTTSPYAKDNAVTFADGGTVKYDFQNDTSVSTAARLEIGNALELEGEIVLNVTDAANTLDGTYELLANTGTDFRNENVTVLLDGEALSAAPINDRKSKQEALIENQKVSIVFEAGDANRTVYYTNAIGDGTWDENVANWMNRDGAGGASTSSYFINNDNVVFDDGSLAAGSAASQTVRVNTNGITVGNMNVSADDHDFTFTGGGITADTLSKTGDGTLTFNQANSFDSGVDISDGEVVMGVMNALGTTGDIDVSNDGRLSIDLDHTGDGGLVGLAARVALDDDGVFSVATENDLTLTQDLNLNAASSGGTFILGFNGSQGTNVISLASGVGISAGGADFELLSGSTLRVGPDNLASSVNAGTVTIGGVIDIGSDSDFTINGNVLFSDGSKLELTLADAGDSLGLLTITGGDLAVGNSQTLNLVINGTASNLLNQSVIIADNAANALEILDYLSNSRFEFDIRNTNEVYISGLKTLGLVPFLEDRLGPPAMSVNHYDGGNYFDRVLVDPDTPVGLLGAMGDYLDALEKIPVDRPDILYKATGQLLGEYGAYGKMPVLHSARGYFRQTNDRLEQRDFLVRIANPSCSPSTTNGIWGGGFGVLARQNSNAEIAGYKFDAGGVILGYDRRIDNRFVVGFAGSYLRGSTRVRDQDAKITTDAMNLGVYADYAHDNGFYARGGLAFSHGWNDSEVGLVVGGRKTGDFKTQAYSANLEVGKVWELPSGINLIPSVGVEYHHLRNESWRERATGMGIPNWFAKDRDDMIDLPLAVRLNRVWRLGNDCYIAPEIRASWIHSTGDRRPGISTGYVGIPGAGYVVKGVETSRNRWLIEAGLRMRLNDRLEASAEYGFEAGRRYREHNFTARVGISF